MQGATSPSQRMKTARRLTNGQVCGAVCADGSQSRRNIPVKERKQLLFFYWCARNHMAEVDAIDVVSVAECIDLFQLIEIFWCDDKG